MTLTASESMIIILTIAAVTFLTRALPFLLFPDHRETPKYIAYLGKVLPYAIIGMLVVYCLKETTLTVMPFGIPELIAVTAVVLLHTWKHNTLLSIAGGTLLYMLMVQFVFV
ncbi:branched-chain amino acid transporter permease [Candidatus Soleaferrea massiliensis]|uniref:branched-chain amino acid transporter permease n=1 Tax=Candidatus Soleaferrea massiliensis TaxID=1470354 RepID=UPI00058D2A9E|nr:branched-chain amino acid transporter permease [Candidatus Soleaferrea massiliensis]